MWKRDRDRVPYTWKSREMRRDMTRKCSPVNLKSERNRNTNSWRSRESDPDHISSKYTRPSNDFNDRNLMSPSNTLRSRVLERDREHMSPNTWQSKETDWDRRRISFPITRRSRTERISPSKTARSRELERNRGRMSPSNTLRSKESERDKECMSPSNTERQRESELNRKCNMSPSNICKTTDTKVKKANISGASRKRYRALIKNGVEPQEALRLAKHSFAELKIMGYKFESRSETATSMCLEEGTTNSNTEIKKNSFSGCQNPKRHLESEIENQKLKMSYNDEEIKRRRLEEISQEITKTGGTFSNLMDNYNLTGGSGTFSNIMDNYNLTAGTSNLIDNYNITASTSNMMENYNFTAGTIPNLVDNYNLGLTIGNKTAMAGDASNTTTYNQEMVQYQKTRDNSTNYYNLERTEAETWQKANTIPNSISNYTMGITQDQNSSYNDITQYSMGNSSEISNFDSVIPRNIGTSPNSTIYYPAMAQDQNTVIENHYYTASYRLAMKQSQMSNTNDTPNSKAVCALKDSSTTVNPTFYSPELPQSLTARAGNTNPDTTANYMSQKISKTNDTPNSNAVYNLKDCTPSQNTSFYSMELYQGLTSRPNNINPDPTANYILKTTDTQKLPITTAKACSTTSKPTVYGVKIPESKQTSFSKGTTSNKITNTLAKDQNTSMPSTTAPTVNNVISQKQKASISCIRNPAANRKRPSQIGIRDFKLMSVDQLKTLYEALIAEIAASEEGKGPSFSGIIIKPGWLLIKYDDNHSKVWLEEKIKKIKLWPDAKLYLVEEEKLLKTNIAVVFIPEPESSDVGKVLRLLRVQNEGLNTESWKVLYKKVEIGGITLSLSIDTFSVEALKRKRNRASLAFQKVHFRIKLAKTKKN